MAQSLQAAFTLLKDRKLAMWNGIATALLVVSQEAFTNYAFRCPCVQDLNVDIVCKVFFIPAVVLLCFGILPQTDTWKAVTGCCPGGDAAVLQWCCRNCCYPAKTEEERQHITGHFQPAGAGGTAGRSCHCCHLWFCSILAKALIAPIVWVSVALLTGDYVACAYSGSTEAGKDLLSKELNVPEVLARIPCPNIPLHANISDDIARQIREEVNNSLHTWSQSCGFCLIGVSLLVGTAIVCRSRCYANKSLKEQRFREQYRQVERKVFKEEAEAFITKHAKQNAKTFFEKQCSADGSIIDLESFHKTWADFSKPEDCSDDKHFSRLQAYAKSITSQQQPPQQPPSPQLSPQQS